MSNSRHLRRGIYLLPTLFTVGNLFCGYASIVKAFHGAVEQAAVLIVVAAVLDALDGRIARLTGTTSEFGLQFDSLADIVSFGVAPALLAYQWALASFGRIGWLIAFLYVVCAAMRLARFNIRVQTGEKRHFAGLPSPMAATLIASAAYAFPEPPAHVWTPVPLTLLVSLAALLMISRFRYRSFKEFDLRNRRSYVYVLPLAAAIVAVALQPKGALLLITSGYAVSAPAAYLWGSVRRTRGAGVGGAIEPNTEVVDEPLLR